MGPCPCASACVPPGIDRNDADQPRRNWISNLNNDPLLLDVDIEAIMYYYILKQIKPCRHNLTYNSLLIDETIEVHC